MLLDFGFEELPDVCINLHFHHLYCPLSHYCYQWVPPTRAPPPPAGPPTTATSWDGPPSPPDHHRHRPENVSLLLFHSHSESREVESQCSFWRRYWFCFCFETRSLYMTPPGLVLAACLRFLSAGIKGEGQHSQFQCSFEINSSDS